MVSSRFWDYSAYAGSTVLAELWEKRDEVEFSDKAFLATLMSECANGDVDVHPWVTALDNGHKLVMLERALRNVLYFCSRADDAGVSQDGYLKGTAYLLLASLYATPAAFTAIEPCSPSRIRPVGRKSRNPPEPTSTGRRRGPTSGIRVRARVRSAAALPRRRARVFRPAVIRPVPGSVGSVTRFFFRNQRPCR